MGRQQSADLAAEFVNWYGVAGVDELVVLVRDAGVRIRYSSLVDLNMPWELVESVAISRRQVPGTSTVQLDDSGDGPVLVLAIASQTNLELEFIEPVVVPVPKTGGEPVAAVRFWADDPAALLARVRSSVADADHIER